MDLPSTYTLDAESLKLNAYRLLCLFYANKGIARLSDPAYRSDSTSQLEQQFFPREMTRLLLNIAIGARVLDDQMRALPQNNRMRQAYFVARDRVNDRYHCMMFDDMPLREVCNKIIHATTVQPHTREGSESHQIDELNWLGWCAAHEDSPDDDRSPEPEPIQWQHLTCSVRLGGRKGDQQWWYLLEVPVFVEAVGELLG